MNPKDGLRYVWIPPGRFTDGCSPGDKECYDDESPTRNVTLTRGFWLGQTEVTQAAYQKVMGYNPSVIEGPDLPADSVTWDEADVYCTAIGGRLPSEPEWEYAARGGTTRRPLRQSRRDRLVRRATAISPRTRWPRRNPTLSGCTTCSGTSSSGPTPGIGCSTIRKTLIPPAPDCGNTRNCVAAAGGTIRTWFGLRTASGSKPTIRITISVSAARRTENYFLLDLDARSNHWAHSYDL